MTHSPMSQNRVRDALTVAEASLQYYLNLSPDGPGSSSAIQSLEKIRAALTAPPASDAAGAEGWKLVPVEPTEAMLDVYWRQAGESQEMRNRTHISARHRYRDLLAAAPTAPAQAPSRPVDAGGVEAACAAYRKGETWLNSSTDGDMSAAAEHRMRMQDALATQAPDKAGAASELDEIRKMLLDGQGDDTGDQILPDFDKGASVIAMVEACVHLLERRRDALTALATQPTGTEASRPVGGEAPPCHWGGGNDIIWCSVCGEEYAYAKGEQRPPCPRTVISTPSAFSDSATSMAILPDREKLNRMACGGASSPTPPQADSTGQGDAWASIQWTKEVTPEINEFGQVTVGLALEEFDRMRDAALSPAPTVSPGGTDPTGWKNEICNGSPEVEPDSTGQGDGWRTKAADEIEMIAELWEGDGLSYAMTIAAILRSEEPAELPADAETKRIVARAWDRFQRGVAATPTPPQADAQTQEGGR